MIVNRLVMMDHITYSTFYLFISNADKELRLLQNTAGEQMPPKPPGLTSTIAGRKPARPLCVATIFSLSKFEFRSDL